MSETLISGSILFIGAHCDDIEIGCGGTAAKFAEKRNPIAFAIATPIKSYEEDKSDSMQFMLEDINELAPLVSKLRTLSHGVSEWLWTQFDVTLRDQLTKSVDRSIDNPDLKRLLVEQLNTVILKGPIFEAKRFSQVKLHPETKRLLDSNKLEELSRVNRMLLEDAYVELLRYHERRRLEASNAAAVLGLSERDRTLFFGSFPDGELDQHYKDLRKWLKQVANEFDPDAVFFHRADDHTDHQAIHKVGLGAFQNKNIFLYYIPRPAPETPFDPNYAETITTFVDRKVAMCNCHASQPDDYIGPDSVLTNSHYWYLRWYGRTAPNKGGHAEPFILRGWRARYYGEPSPNSASQVPAVKYDLRLVREADGTLRWEEG